MAESSPAGETQLVRLQREAIALGARLREAGPVTAFCHENPDGDTIGAAIAMVRASQQLGCRAEVVSIDGIPPAYAYLTHGLSVGSRPTLDPGLAIVCDAATLDRVGAIGKECRSWFAASTIVNIDHHVTNTRFGALNLVDPEAAASCQVVAWILPQIGVQMDAEISSAVLTGIIRDSHGFSTATTTPATLRAAAGAVEAGAQMEPIYRATLLELPLVAIDLWGRLLSDVHADAGGRIAWTLLTPSMLAMTGAQQHHAEGVSELLARAEGVEVSVLFRELGGRTRVSIRTGPGVEAAAIAAVFGGGGHTRRAGCTLETGADAAIPLVLDACRRQLAP
ncbi:MAG: DHH family phosphoesterase [Acidimicrobiales bacterium]